MDLGIELTKFFKENFQNTSSKGLAPSVIINPSKKRIDYIDLAKGLCIILVVLFHSGYMADTPAVKAMRMPLYFILSGLFYKDYGSLLNLIKKKANRLLMPFLFFFTLFLIVLIIPAQDSLSTIINEIERPFVEPKIVNLPIWFLLCLFFVNIIYYAVNQLNIMGGGKSLLILSIGLLGYWLNYHNIYLPLFLSSAFSAIPFFYIGVLLRKLPILYYSNHDITILVFSLVSIIMVVLYCIQFGTPYIEFQTNKYSSGNLFEIYIVSTILVISLLMICKVITWLPVISYIGRYSVIILGCHAIYLNFLGIGVNLIMPHYASDFEIKILSWILCWISIPIYRKLFPYFTAQKDILTIQVI